MNKHCLILSLSFASLNADVGHQSSGSSYGDSGVVAYAEVRHGSDGALFAERDVFRDVC